jgi:TM2 domain-containing membrane protein YozV
VLRSDKNRTTAAFLQIIPGVGRMYLGYGAYGALQFLLMFCGGVGVIWSIIDGIMILSGAVKHDGYGRSLDP